MIVSGQSSGTTIKLGTQEVRAWYNLFRSCHEEGVEIAIGIDADGTISINGHDPVLRQSIADALRMASSGTPPPHDVGVLADAVLDVLP